MRPYLAVLKDSFREALVSRVLWILLVLATLTLAAIAPMGLTEQAAAYLLPRDLRKPPSLIDKLRTQGQTADTPAQRVWQRLSEDLRQSLKEYPRSTGLARPSWMVVNELRDELNELIEDATFYDSAAWRGIDLNQEAQGLLKTPPAKLPADDLARLNRLLLEAAFPEEIAPTKETQVRFAYLGMKLGDPLPLEKEPLIRGALTGFVNLFVGVLGVFAGILVTASIVPQTFEAGAIDLLLSKPISRVFLFLTKFFGGCAFILITALYFVGGLWLIVGLRFGLCVFAPIGQRRQRAPFVPAAPTVGPLFDASAKRLLAVQAAGSPFGGMSSSQVLLVGKAEDDFKQIEGPAAPDGTLALWVDGGRIFAVGSADIFRLEGDPTEKSQKMTVLGFEIPLDDKGARFVEIGPKLQLGSRASAAVHAETFDVAVYDPPRLSLFARQESGRYQLRRQAEIDLGKSGLIALGGSHVLLAGEDGRIKLLDATALTPLEEFRPFQANAPRFVAISRDGRHGAVLFHHGKLWLYDFHDKRDLSSTIAGHGDISAVTMAGDRLYVTDRLKRVTQYRLDTLERAERWKGQLQTLEMVYRYVLRPVYTVFPKPGELDNLVSYLLSEEETVAVGDNPGNLAAARVKLNIWEPFWSSLAFLAVVLAMGGVYVHFKDF
jgi:hypothetical protein